MPCTVASQGTVNAPPKHAANRRISTVSAGSRPSRSTITATTFAVASIARARAMSHVQPRARSKATIFSVCSARRKTFRKKGFPPVF